LEKALGRKRELELQTTARSDATEGKATTAIADAAVEATDRDQTAKAIAGVADDLNSPAASPASPTPALVQRAEAAPQGQQQRESKRLADQKASSGPASKVQVAQATTQKLI